MDSFTPIVRQLVRARAGLPRESTERPKARRLRETAAEPWLSSRRYSEEEITAAIRDARVAAVEALPARLRDRLERDESGCLLWTGGKTSQGYGVTSFAGRTYYVHRLIFQLLGHEIPHGYVLDHVAEWGCEHKHCAEPAHLEPVTTAENSRRGQLRRWAKVAA